MWKLAKVRAYPEPGLKSAMARQDRDSRQWETGKNVGARVRQSVRDLSRHSKDNYKSC